MDLIKSRDYIILHHSKGNDRIVRDTSSIRRYHIERCGYDEIAYHYILEQVQNDYKICEGRALMYAGAHALGFNYNSIGICICGDYDEQYIDVGRMIKLLVLIKSLQLIYDIPIKRVLGHRETYVLRNRAVEKTCPGAKVSMDEIREALKII